MSKAYPSNLTKAQFELLNQSVKSAAMVCKAVGYDAGKNIKGRKRFITVDTLGLVLRVLVTAANVTQREGGIQVLQSAIFLK